MTDTKFNIEKAAKIIINKMNKEEEQAFDEQFNNPMEAIGQLVDEAKRLKEKYSDKEKGQDE